MLANILRAQIVMKKKVIYVCRTNTHTFYFVMVSNAISSTEIAKKTEMMRKITNAIQHTRSYQRITDFDVKKQKHQIPFTHSIPLHCIASHLNKLCVLQVHICKYIKSPYIGLVLFCTCVYALCYQYVTHSCMSKWMIEIEMYQSPLFLLLPYWKVGYAETEKDLKRHVQYKCKKNRDWNVSNPNVSMNIDGIPIMGTILCNKLKLNFLNFV